MFIDNSSSNLCSSYVSQKTINKILIKDKPIVYYKKNKIKYTPSKIYKKNTRFDIFYKYK